MAWEGDIKDDLVKTLPTKHKPTSLPEVDIKQAIGTLVSDWAEQLKFRLKQRAFDWEIEDYPKVDEEKTSLKYVQSIESGRPKTPMRVFNP